MEYTWNIKKAKQQLRYLESHNQDGQYNLDIDSLKQIINNSIVPFEYMLTLKEKLEFDQEKLDEYSYFMETIEEFYNLTKRCKCGYLYEIDLPISELLCFVNDFFKEVYPEWYSLFNEVYKERRNNFQVKNSRSFELYIPGVNYSYINFQKKNTIEDLFAIVHEFTHAVVDRIKYRYSYDSKYPLVELPSLTSELISSDIINSFYTNVKEEVKYYLGGSMASLHVYAGDIIKIKNFLETHTLDNDDQIQHNIKYLTNKSVRTKEALTDKILLENICYVVPYIYAIELYYLYSKDHELFQYDMNKIITMDNCSNYFEELKRLGLVPNQHTKQFIHTIKRG